MVTGQIDTCITIKTSVQDNLRSLELLYTRSALRVDLPDMWLKAVC